MTPHPTDSAGPADIPAPLDAAATDGTPTDLVLEELLVEDVSIDGMCGVY